MKNIRMIISGNYYLDRDPKCFRHILAYLRLKKEKFVPSLALPAKPDDLAKYESSTTLRLIKINAFVQLSAATSASRNFYYDRTIIS